MGRLASLHELGLNHYKSTGSGIGYNMYLFVRGVNNTLSTYPSPEHVCHICAQLNSITTTHQHRKNRLNPRELGNIVVFSFLSNAHLPSRVLDWGADRNPHHNYALASNAQTSHA